MSWLCQGTTAPGFTQVDFGYDDFGRRVAVYANLQVVIAGSVTDDDAKKAAPAGWKSPKPYIRIVPQPK